MPKHGMICGTACVGEERCRQDLPEGNTMKYFLTGATGFIGARVAQQLAAAGHQLVAVVRSPEQAQELAKLGATIHKGDVTDKESMRAAMTGVDGIFHIAGWYKIGVRDKRPGQQINVQGTRNVLELMRDLKI